MSNHADELHKYTQMQKTFYDTSGETVESLVGYYENQEKFPYETNLLYFNGDVRKPIFPDFKPLRAFDIACGEGRMIRRMQSFFSRVDGADISQKMVTAARDRCTNSDIYLTEGMDCGASTSHSYDFAYCTISMQHICVYDVRRSIIKDIVRILKPEGKMTLQLAYSRHFPYLHIEMYKPLDGGLAEIMMRNQQHASYFENKVDATTTNSGCDVIIGPDDLAAVRKDLLELFGEVDYWYSDMSVMSSAYDPPSTESPPPPITVTHAIFIHCAKPRK